MKKLLSVAVCAMFVLPLAGAGASTASVPTDLPTAARVTIKVVMDRKKPNGKPWDAFGNAPDPYVKVDGTSHRGSRCQDAHTCELTVVASGGAMSIEVWDADMSRDDSAGVTVCAVGNVCPTGEGATVYVQ